ncbi:C-type mannose receptor 2 [Plakobranchus ocellatus]|uniref:C-type mannose receptor 2 n=1 Tax=Plakobranchus ocellatus TaxID=259542 RepID=A0AAV4BHY9_9GAST|nr:C-type mannose receptor 2 [Plakobranchus ocellatus]
MKVSFDAKTKTEAFSLNQKKMLQPLVFVVAIAFVTVTADRIDEFMCPKGWRYFKYSCYYIGDVGVDFSDAEMSCIDLDSELAAISSKEEHNYIKSIVQDTGAKGVWFGLALKYGDWEYVHDWRFPLTFLNWAKNEPDTSSGAGCGALYKPLGWAWKAERCGTSTGMTYVCEKRAFLHACASRTCFKLLDYRKSYANAKADCKGRGGSLASIRSEEEINAVKDTVFSSRFLSSPDGWKVGRSDIWLAGSDSGSEGVWYWDIEGQRQKISDGFSNWMDNEPNNAGPSGRDENCMIMRPGSWEWNDIMCDSSTYFLCELSEQVLIAITDS